MPAGCTYRECGRPVLHRGLCNAHYLRMMRGRPMDAPMILRGEAAFWSHVDKTDDCWKWTGFIEAKGYGRANFGRRPRLAHHVAWELSGGRKLRRGECLMHTCDVRNCIRPDHLRVGTPALNSRDMVLKERSCAALTLDRKKEGHRLRQQGLSVSAIARRLGVEEYVVKNLFSKKGLRSYASALGGG